MSVQNDHQVSHSQAEDAWADHGSDFVLITERKPPPRIELAKERMFICRLYLGLMRTITDDYGAEFAAHSDSLAYRTIGIYVFLRTGSRKGKGTWQKTSGSLIPKRSCVSS
jgi:hypothetical protein